MDQNPIAVTRRRVDPAARQSTVSRQPARKDDLFLGELRQGTADRLDGETKIVGDILPARRQWYGDRGRANPGIARLQIEQEGSDLLFGGFTPEQLTALNLLPSIATLASPNRPRRRHGTTNSRQTLRIASPLSLRKSAMVLKSGIRWPVRQTNSMLRWHSRSRRPLYCTRLRYP